MENGDRPTPKEKSTRNARRFSPLARIRAAHAKQIAILCSFLLPLAACRSAQDLQRPSIVFVHTPPSQSGGPELLDDLSGKVINGPPGAKIVAYARNSEWWIQPFRSRPFTEIGSDGNWKTATHLGTDYAVLLVSPGYQPPVRIKELPAIGGAVLAIALTKGNAGQSIAPKILHFSGYDWAVSSSADYRGGELSDYEPSNAWVDDHGHLHLLMSEGEGQWHCAGIRLTRSLGYGTYRFVVQDTVHLPTSAVLAMFTRDDRQNQEDGAEMNIELSHWGKQTNRNADCVVQPYYVPENTVHYNVPAGPMTYELRWEPGNATFRTFSGNSEISAAHKIMEHVFKAGIPIPAAETVHMNFYDFHHSKSGLHHPVEVVVERFEYLP
ncbi:glycoside hydrolase family 16 protein [Occallatibacter riparius]|uniref:Glycoside hydrolase family 16 protein n=1 Tax=Occallatibacter riparius TaxID=1002689 RepID=A0A9J7BH27_9BACT|nr:glycoside hydrolase family 16 protein [Occallatibacter riparius]UWZ81691.1 glycoside hydrolase family 16 protein [Occallatibacter riparius]